MERDAAMEWLKNARRTYDAVKSGKLPIPEGKDPQDFQEEARDELHKACRAFEEADNSRRR